MVEVSTGQLLAELIAGLRQPPDLVNNRPPLVVNPAAEPGSTLSAPASPMVPTSSSGAEAARSANPSWLKSPAANANPNRSRFSAFPPTWVNNRPPLVVSPQPIPAAN